MFVLLLFNKKGESALKPLLNPIHSQLKSKKKGLYIPIKSKFWISHCIAFLWMCFSIYLSLPSLMDLAQIISFPLALLIIGGISYIPGYMNAFLVISLILDHQPAFNNTFPDEEITILIAAHNEEDNIFTLSY